MHLGHEEIDAEMDLEAANLDLDLGVRLCHLQPPPDIPVVIPTGRAPALAEADRQLGVFKLQPVAEPLPPLELDRHHRQDRVKLGEAGQRSVK